MIESGDLSRDRSTRRAERSASRSKDRSSDHQIDRSITRSPDQEINRFAVSDDLTTNTTCSYGCCASRASRAATRSRVRRHALHGAVGHVGRGLAAAGHGRDVGALRHEIQNHLVVAAGGGVVQRRVAVVVPRVDVGAKHFDQVLHRRHPAVRRVPMRVAGKALAVLHAGGGVNREGAGATRRNRRRGVALLAVTRPSA